MLKVERELVFDQFVVSLGLRKSLGVVEEDGEGWEVYSHLVSGTDAILFAGCTKGEAENILTFRIAHAAMQGGRNFVVTKESSAVDSRFIIRVSIDKNHNGHVCLIEDTTGRMYPVKYGSEEECVNFSERLGRDILGYNSLSLTKGDDDHDDEASATVTESGHD